MRAIYTLENVLYRLGDGHAALTDSKMATFEIRNGRNVSNGLSKRRAEREREHERLIVMTSFERELHMQGCQAIAGVDDV